MNLTEKQNAVLKAVLNASPGDFIVLRGFAGTGKSVTASEIMKRITKPTLVITPTAAALAVLKRKIDSQEIKYAKFKTIASLMSRHQSVLKLGAFKEFYPVVQMREEIEKMRIFSKLDLRSVFDVINEIAELHPNLTNEIISESIIVKYSTRQEEILINDEAHFNKLIEQKTNDLSFSFENFIMIIDTEKLAQTFIDVFKVNPFAPIVEESVFEYKEIDKIASDLSKYSLVVIDEMSMMSDSQANVYKSAIKQCTNRPVTLISGDPGQLKPVEGNFNEWCHSEEDGNSIFELKEILRSTDEIANMGQMIRMNVPINLIAQSDPRIKEFNRGTSINKIYAENENDFKESDIVLAFTNKDVNELNQKIRYSKKLIGHVQSNDKLVVNKNSGRIFGEIMHANGQIYTVTRDLSKEIFSHLEQAEMQNLQIKRVKDALRKELIKFIEVKDDEDLIHYIFVSSNCHSLMSKELKEIESSINRTLRNNLNSFDLQHLHEFFKTLSIDEDQLRYYKFPFLVDVKYAHAMTVHKSQGSQFKNVVYVVSSRDLWIQSQDLKDSRFKQSPVYVAVTRAIENIKIFYIK